jgi:hypothetical protein
LARFGAISQFTIIPTIGQSLPTAFNPRAFFRQDSRGAEDARPQGQEEGRIAPTKANGIVKTNVDGSRMWVGDIGADGVMKVNHLAVGNALI